MDPVIDKIVEETVPHGHKELLHGLVKLQLEDSAAAVDRIFKEAARSFPPILEYRGYRILTPHESYRFLLDGSGVREYDIAKCSLFLAEYEFATTADDSGEEVIIKRKLYLPYTELDGSVYLSGNKYYFKPVLTDRIVSSTGSGFFIRLMQDKFSCIEEGYNIQVDGRDEMVFILKTPLLPKLRQRTTKKKPIIVPSAVHYILSKYGLKHVMEKYLKVEYVVTTKEKYDGRLNDTHTMYSGGPQCSSNMIFLIKNTDLRGILKKETVGRYMGGLFYTMDVIAQSKIKPIEIDELDDPAVWKTRLTNLLVVSLLGKITPSAGPLLREIDTHYKKLDTYLEKQLQDYLMYVDSSIGDFYELLNYIISNSKRLRSESNIWDKYLDVSYYIFYTIIEGIFMIKNILHTRLNNGNRVTSRDVSKRLQTLTTRMFLNIIRGGKRNIVLDTVDYSGDNIYLGMTQLLTLQELGDGVNQSSRNAGKTLPDSVKKLHAYDIAIGSLLSIFKSRPTPRTRLNMFVQYDLASGRIITTKRYKQKLNTVQKLLEGNMKFSKLS